MRKKNNIQVAVDELKKNYCTVNNVYMCVCHRGDIFSPTIGLGKLLSFIKPQGF